MQAFIYICVKNNSYCKQKNKEAVNPNNRWGDKVYKDRFENFKPLTLIMKENPYAIGGGIHNGQQRKLGTPKQLVLLQNF